MNPILTQLAKTRRAVFVEGKDFQILGQFARKLGFSEVGNRADFAVIPLDGFNPNKVRILKAGMETTLGGTILAALILDRDFRSDSERTSVAKACEEFCTFVSILPCKEIENFLLVPSAIDRAAETRVRDKSKRSGSDLSYTASAEAALHSFCSEKRSYVTAQLIDFRRRYEKIQSPRLADATVTEAALGEFEKAWLDFGSRLRTIPGKEGLAFINQQLQTQVGVSVTPTSIIDAMKSSEIFPEMIELVSGLKAFAKKRVGAS